MSPIKSLTPLQQLMLFGIGLYSGSVYALEVNVATFLTNLAKTVPNLMQLTTAIAYVMGMWLIIKSIIGLKHYGDSRSSGGQGQGLKGPLITMAVGGALFYLPSSVQVGLSTFWANPTPYAYYNENNDTWSELINSVFMIIQLVGTIAFIRGLIIMSHMGEGKEQGATFGKAMAHIIGGILCINMYQFLQVIFNTLALGQV